jgi:hypothetical protein
LCSMDENESIAPQLVCRTLKCKRHIRKHYRCKVGS